MTILSAWVLSEFGLAKGLWGKVCYFEPENRGRSERCELSLCLLHLLAVEPSSDELIGARCSVLPDNH